MKKELMRRRYSQRTIESYLFCVDKFLSSVRKHPRKITKKDIKDYLDDLALRNKAGSTINLHLSSIKFLLGDVLRRNINIRLKYSRRPKSLPVFLSKDEAKRLFDAIKNPKHKLMIKLMYSAGLRVSELVNLKVRDFEFENDFGWVRRGKGNKDRPFIVAESIREELMDLISKNCNDIKSWLFKGRNGHITVATLQRIVKNAAKKAKITKNVHTHTLRHSFATHLVNDGTKLSEVQSLLGHNSIETTQTYLHTANVKLISVKSPLDTL